MMIIFDVEVLRKLALMVFLICISIPLKKQNNAETNKWSSTVLSRWYSISSFQSSTTTTKTPLLTRPVFWSTKNRTPEVDTDGETHHLQPLEYDFYRESCPHAESIVQAIVRDFSGVRSDVSPALLRLVFHDCFIEGCDASILLDSAEGIKSEKEAPPNEFLKGFDVIDTIKSELEEVCPGIVSCADVVVLAAREAVVLAGGPFYPLKTGRRDSALSFYDVAKQEIPSPHGNVYETLASFASRGFDEREAVSLLGAHSIAGFHCKFFQNRLYNFSNSSEVDPSMDTEFLNQLRSECSNSQSSAQPPSSQCSAISTAPSSSFDGMSSSSIEGPAIQMNYETSRTEFGTIYYRSLLQSKGILYSDQQLISGEETEIWVRAYASDASLFRRDFAQAMMKLSNIQVLTAPLGQIRSNCAKVV